LGGTILGALITGSIANLTPWSVTTCPAMGGAF